MSIQFLAERAQDQSFYLSGVGHERSLKEFQEKAEKINQLVGSALCLAKTTPLTLENREIITKAVLRTNERMILRLYDYVIKNEGDQATFHLTIRDEVVKYLGSIQVPPVVPGSKSVDQTKINALIEVFCACSPENNRIDWPLLNRLIFSFNRMQRQSFEISSLPVNNLA
jgi:hypothetical protein